MKKAKMDEFMDLLDENCSHGNSTKLCKMCGVQKSESEGQSDRVIFAPSVFVNISPGEVESEGVDAKETASKALNSRSLHIPHHVVAIQQDVQRSATTQTSNMYTKLAKPVQETMDIVENSAQERQRRLDTEKSQQIEAARRKFQEDMNKNRETTGTINIANFRKYL